jgi:hypothetical protein
MATTKTSSFFNIGNFRAALDAGAKPNLFSVKMDLPTGVSGGGVAFQNNMILCKSAAIPALTVGTIEVPYRGRRIKLPGDRSYGDWTITIVNDNKQTMRKAFDRWLKYINNPDASADIRNTQNIDYKVPIDIAHLKINGKVSRRYQLVDAFPIDVSAIDLSYDTTDAIQEFTVTFMYSHVLFSGLAAGIAVDAPAIVEKDTINLPASISDDPTAAAAAAAGR